MAYADTIYRNMDDTVRLSVYRQSGDNKGWDVQVFDIEEGHLGSFTGLLAESAFRTKRDLLAWAKEQYGRLTVIDPNPIQEGWPPPDEESVLRARRRDRRVGRGRHPWLSPLERP